MQSGNDTMALKTNGSELDAAPAVKVAFQFERQSTGVSLHLHTLSKVNTVELPPEDVLVAPFSAGMRACARLTQFNAPHLCMTSVNQSLATSDVNDDPCGTVIVPRSILDAVVA